MPRSRARIPIAVGLAILFTLPACGGSGGSTSVDNLCTDLQGAICSYLRRCDYEMFLKLITHQPCEELLACEELDLEEAEKSIAAGRLSYNASLAGAALAEIRNASCNNLDGALDGFDEKYAGIFTGLVAEGDACYHDQECAAGSCNESVETCPGQCEAFVPMDGDCSNGECDPKQADCVWNTDAQTSLCTALAGEDESCETVSCAVGTKCDLDASPNICRAPGAAGEDCTSWIGCQSGLTCLGDKCTAPAGPNQACDLGTDYEGALAACQSGLYCDVDLINQQTTGICRSKKTSGQECLVFWECGGNLLCTGTTVSGSTVVKGHCGPPLGLGANCSTLMPFTECNYDLYCGADGKCARMPRAGDPCVYDEDPECVGSDLYCDSLQSGEAGTCRAKKGALAECTSGEECLSGWCSGGTCQSAEVCTAP